MVRRLFALAFLFAALAAVPQVGAPAAPRPASGAHAGGSTYGGPTPPPHPNV